MEANIIRIQKRENPFVMIDKAFIRNPKLSAKAKGLLVYLLSLPPTWQPKVRELTKHFTDGELSIRNGLKELMQQGYAHHERIRDEQGTFTTSRWLIFETPQGKLGSVFEPYLNPNSTSNDQKRSDVHAQPHRENPHAENRNAVDAVHSVQKSNPHRGFPHVDNPHVDNPRVAKNVQEVNPRCGFPHVDNQALYNNIINNINNSDQYQYQDQGKNTELATSTVEVAKTDQRRFSEHRMEKPKTRTVANPSFEPEPKPLPDPPLATQPITGGVNASPAVDAETDAEFEADFLKNDVEAGTSNQVPEPSQAKDPSTQATQAQSEVMQSMIGKKLTGAQQQWLERTVHQLFLSDGETLRQLRLGEQQLFERMAQTLLDPKQFSLANMQFLKKLNSLKKSIKSGRWTALQDAKPKPIAAPTPTPQETIDAKTREQQDSAKAKLLALDSEVKFFQMQLDRAKAGGDAEKIKHCQIMLDQKQGEYWEQQVVVLAFQEKRGGEKIDVPENQPVTE